MNISEKKIVNTDKKELSRLFQLQNGFQYEYGNQPIEKRVQRLNKLKKSIENNREGIVEAVFNDFRKPAVEVNATEILPVIAEIKHAKRNIGRWTSVHSVPTPLSMLGSSSKIIMEPKGVGLIISPWNFPIMLTLAPLVGAIAAGCPVILKPSENTPHSSEILQKIISEAFGEQEVALVQGDAETSTYLLGLPFNHIYFTGAPSIGKIVMKAAAEHLASVTLELGGKSPVIVDESANIKNAAKRISWAKFINAGQICIAPDYLLVHSKVKDKLIAALRSQLEDFFTKQAKDSGSYSRIVNRKHFERLDGYLKDALNKNGNFEFGGKVDADQNYIEPTVISGLDDDAKLLEDEIFGPVLPIIEFDDIKEVPKIVQSREKPLALYIYSGSKKNINFVVNNTRACGTAVNHSLVHIMNPNLPFGGSNNSGIGKGMGYFGFLEFTNQRGYLKQVTPISATDLLTPPYNGFSKWLVSFTEKYLS
ncbi:aldehyde dehydrogenase family protein [Portibacter lacus]|uniref:Aldehyde dehydrogenase n=1 Tax=Portibacter lacus TaxID=1099794 RepID=A0AA37STZ6_9BACT|nr:aldehyde dehydrogenase family protein [Portibacter lacus]GLR19270.1 aldehyde dehydrogenase [Portibacter lacus]